MSTILIFGNSGSGKSTLAKQLCEAKSLAHLDLDTLAWQKTSPPTRMSIAESAALIEQFTKLNTEWVIEGCYSDLLALVKGKSSEIIFLNLPIDMCISNARKRPWEPHKYPSKAAQDDNLDMLVEWIAQYEVRSDTFSKTAHQSFYDEYEGIKTMYCDNSRCNKKDDIC
ncbi:AAA family ATPase [Thalassotalea profundi]|uniref:AAA family ATPase n=1 Tax=Thalassotalea profundi TaxID=2036687 RepID=UPI001674C9D7|nr:AAA family ATPase [Thalassotalea profundi]